MFTVSNFIEEFRKRIYRSKQSTNAKPRIFWNKYLDIIVVEKKENMTKPQAKAYAREWFKNQFPNLELPVGIKTISSKNWKDDFAIDLTEKAEA